MRRVIIVLGAVPCAIFCLGLILGAASLGSNDRVDVY